jgi:hypothetical protein
MAEDQYMPGRHPGEPVEDYEARMAAEAKERGLPVEEHKEGLTSEQFRAGASE